MKRQLNARTCYASVRRLGPTFKFEATVPESFSTANFEFQNDIAIFDTSHLPPCSHVLYRKSCDHGGRPAQIEGR